MWECQRIVVIVSQWRAMAIAVRNGSGLGLHIGSVISPRPQSRR